MLMFVNIVLLVKSYGPVSLALRAQSGPQMWLLTLAGMCLLLAPCMAAIFLERRCSAARMFSYGNITQMESKFGRASLVAGVTIGPGLPPQIQVVISL